LLLSIVVVLLCPAVVVELVFLVRAILEVRAIAVVAVLIVVVAAGSMTSTATAAATTATDGGARLVVRGHGRRSQRRVQRAKLITEGGSTPGRMVWWLWI
jgi:hypothetical protein